MRAIRLVAGGLLGLTMLFAIACGGGDEDRNTDSKVATALSRAGVPEVTSTQPKTAATPAATALASRFDRAKPVDLSTYDLAIDDAEGGGKFTLSNVSIEGNKITLNLTIEAVTEEQGLDRLKLFILDEDEAAVWRTKFEADEDWEEGPFVRLDVTPAADWIPIGSAVTYTISGTSDEVINDSMVAFGLAVTSYWRSNPPTALNYNHFVVREEGDPYVRLYAESE